MLYNEAARTWIANPEDYEGFPVFSLIRGVKLTALVGREHGHEVYVDDYTGNEEAVALTCHNCARHVVTWIDPADRSVNAGSAFSWLCEGSHTIAPKFRRAYEVTGIARFDGRSVKITTTLNRKEAERIAKYQSREVSPWASVSITEVPAI